MKTDRELLELAAKAAGLLDQLTWTPGATPWMRHGDVARPWNPLTDDGDALRLAVKLNIHITSSTVDAWASTEKVTAIEPMGDDSNAATRRAIVRAAAAIGESGADQ